MSTIDILKEIFCTVFDNPDINIQPEMTANDVEGWDSLSHVNLILAVENHFNIHFTQKELRSLKKVGDLIHSIESKIS
ncbi:MAG: acyl carrier protein [Anaerolineales bacterium]|jgi:acyl carrier protein